MSSSSGSKKRVRFSDAGPQVHEYEVEPKRRALDPMEQLEGEISGVCLDPSADMDAGQAAAQRAACRRNQLLAAFEEGTGVRQGDDVEGEEDYEDPEEMFDSVTGVPIEPFHLKREREEGYFDEDGTYVEYKRDEVEDAWADSLANVEVDEEWLARVLGGRGRAEAAGAAAAAAREAPDMSAEEVRERKRRVVDLLLPGENVLQALRRLAAVRQPAGAAPAVNTAGSGGGGGGSGGSPAAEALAQHARALRGPAMPPAVREKFEQLTELSSVLMDQGEYSVHSMTREQLERSIQGGASGTQGGAAGCASPIVRQPAAASASGDSGQQLAERLLAAAAPAAGGGGGGQNGSAKAPGTGAAGGGSEDAARAAQQAAADADLEDMFAEEEPPAAAGAGAAEPAQPAAQSSGGSVVGQPPHQQQQEVGGSIRRHTSDEQMQEVEQPAGEAAQQQQQQQAPQADSAAAGSQQQQEQVQQGAPAAGGQPPELDGFVLDQSTGLWYNSDMGMYFDSTRRLFGDSSSGQWYSYDAASGQYTPVPSAT